MKDVIATCFSMPQPMAEPRKLFHIAELMTRCSLQLGLNLTLSVPCLPLPA